MKLLLVPVFIVPPLYLDYAAASPVQIFRIGSDLETQTLDGDPALPPPVRVEAVSDSSSRTADNDALNGTSTVALRTSASLSALINQPSPSNDSPEPVINTTTPLLPQSPERSCFSPGQVQPIPRPSCDELIQLALIDLDIYPAAIMSWSYSPRTRETPNIPNKLLPGDGTWSWKGCTIAVRNRDHREVRWFRLMDVAKTALDVLDTCKQGYGGTLRIGKVEGVDMGGFFVGVGSWEVKQGGFGSDWREEVGVPNREAKRMATAMDVI